ncbi:MAG: protein kinase domain-containing protein [Porphyromonas sp.]
MQYPQLTEYIKAISNSADNFDKLSHLRPVLDKDNNPQRNVGGFAVVFKMQDEDTGRMYAIKCFHDEQNGRDQAYKAISQTLLNNKSPYLMEVNYFEKELFVDTIMSDKNEYPVLQMDWIDGETMESFIATHYRDQVVIKDLHEKFCNLALWLRSQPFAHGDIKPDNIMVRKDGSLVLIDYDGMFVPELKGKISPTIGTKGFAHPLRTSEDFNRDIDDFALASISISLLAISEDIDLFKNFSTLDRLLFSYEDYLNLPDSKIFKKLTETGGLLPKLLELFCECLKTNDNNKNLYDQIFDFQTKAPEIIFFESNLGNTVYEEDEVILNWRINNTTQVFINGVNVSERTYFKYKIKKSMDFELTALNGLKETKTKIAIEALPKVKISLKSNSSKLRKGKEDLVILTWDVKNSQSATLVIGDKQQRIKSSDKISISLKQPTIIAVNAIGLDGEREFQKHLQINIFSEADVVFSANRYYTMPSVPVQLSWSVSHAKEVELIGHGKVSPSGSIIVYPQTTSIYTLKVTDAFGITEQDLKIQMLPIPHIKTFSIPTPQLNNKLNITISIPAPNIQTKLPHVSLMGVELKAPFIPSLSELGLDIKPNERIKKQINLWTSIKSIYTYCKNIIFKYER